VCGNPVKSEGVLTKGAYSKEGEWFLWYQDLLFVVVWFVICDWLLVEPSGCSGNWI